MQADSFSFVIGGHRVHIEASRHCFSPSCVSVSIPGDLFDAPQGRPISTTETTAPMPPSTPAGSRGSNRLRRARRVRLSLPPSPSLHAPSAVASPATAPTRHCAAAQAAGRDVDRAGDTADHSADRDPDRARAAGCGCRAKALEGRAKAGRAGGDAARRLADRRKHGIGPDPAMRPRAVRISAQPVVEHRRRSSTDQHEAEDRRSCGPAISTAGTAAAAITRRWP